MSEKNLPPTHKGRNSDHDLVTSALNPAMCLCDILAKTQEVEGDAVAHVLTALLVHAEEVLQRGFEEQNTNAAASNVLDLMGRIMEKDPKYANVLKEVIDEKRNEDRPQQ